MSCSKDSLSICHFFNDRVKKCLRSLLDRLSRLVSLILFFAKVPVELWAISTSLSYKQVIVTWSHFLEIGVASAIKTHIGSCSIWLIFYKSLSFFVKLVILLRLKYFSFAGHNVFLYFNYLRTRYNCVYVKWFQSVLNWWGRLMTFESCIEKIWV